ncbi:hypothetical protein BDV37DRAFT_279067 [Aspergillus pseudonomiae]|uniref:Uncharacterized protein n=1 Tax=Aspergillus pseudonomiae TaxID=1506151 RepID=A0A5N7DQ56_9EURO|nr:uncharacterized protein BDV37DRAFT_279067 [Aspergillus pseudonomiae]KAE8408582.1 hypothetical protein BDV37DRAFT_279067 [Aspergillus pseudonomiae]
MPLPETVKVWGKPGELALKAICFLAEGKITSEPLLLGHSHNGYSKVPARPVCAADKPKNASLDEIDQERMLIQDCVSLMETYAADPVRRASRGPQDSPEDLLVILESLSHGRGSAEKQLHDLSGLYHLYQPIQQVVPMLLPDRGASETLVRFVLSELSWLHCGVRTAQFWGEHQLFWAMMERGHGDLLQDHAWMALYLGILAAACLYLSPDQRPPLPQLLHLPPGAVPATGEADPSVALARIWFEPIIVHRV